MGEIPNHWDYFITLIATIASEIISAFERKPYKGGYLYKENTSLRFCRKKSIIEDRSNEMAVKVKPVQPTEIKDKKMVREVIEHIHKPIPAAIYRRNKKLVAYIKQFEH